MRARFQTLAASTWYLTGKMADKAGKVDPDNLERQGVLGTMRRIIYLTAPMAEAREGVASKDNEVNREHEAATEAMGAL